MAIFPCLRLHATAGEVISTLGIDLRFKPMQIESGGICRSSPDIGGSAVKMEESLQMVPHGLWLRFRRWSHRQRLVLRDRTQQLVYVGRIGDIRYWSVWSGFKKLAAWMKLRAWLKFTVLWTSFERRVAVNRTFEFRESQC